jgi:hypothetical protein
MEQTRKHVVSFIHSLPGRTIVTPSGPRQEVTLTRTTEEIQTLDDLMAIQLRHLDDPRFKFDPPLEDWVKKSALFIPRQVVGRPANDGRERRWKLSIEEPSAIHGYGDEDEAHDEALSEMQFRRKSA